MAEDYTQWLKRKFDEMEAQLTTLEQEVEGLKRSEFWKLSKNTYGLDFL